MDSKAISVDSLANPDCSPSKNYKKFDVGVDVPLMYKNGKAVVNFASTKPANPTSTGPVSINQTWIPKTVLDKIHPARTSQATPAFPPQPWTARLASIGGKVFGSSSNDLNSVDSTFSWSDQAQSCFINSSRAPDNANPQDKTSKRLIDLSAMQQQPLHDRNAHIQVEDSTRTKNIEKTNMYQAAQGITETTHDTSPLIYRADVKACIDLTHVCKYNGLPPPLIQVEVCSVSNNNCEFSAKVMLGHMGDHVFSSIQCISREDARLEALSRALQAFEKIDEVTRQSKQIQSTKDIPRTSTVQPARRLSPGHSNLRSKNAIRVSRVHSPHGRDRTHQNQISAAEPARVKDCIFKNQKLPSIIPPPARPTTKLSQEDRPGSFDNIKAPSLGKGGLKRPFTDYGKPRELPKVELPPDILTSCRSDGSAGSSFSYVQTICEILGVQGPTMVVGVYGRLNLRTCRVQCNNPSFAGLSATGPTEAVAFDRIKTLIVDKLRRDGLGRIVDMAESYADSGVVGRTAKRRKLNEKQIPNTGHFNSLNDKVCMNGLEDDVEELFMIDPTGDPKLRPSTG